MFLFTSDGTKTDLVTMDKSTCQTTFLASDQTNGFAVDVAAAIGGGASLEGTNTRANNGTYGFPYIILGKAFTVNVSITGSDGNTYVGRSDGNVYTSGPTDLVDNLTNFGMQIIASKMYENYDQLPKIFFDILNEWKKENKLEESPFVSRFLGSNEMFKDVM